MITQKKILLGITLLLISATAFSLLKSSRFFQKNADSPDITELPIIAITQIIEHPSLDQEREAIIETLNKEGYVDGKTVRIVYQNAQGNLPTASQIAGQVAGQHPKVVIAISTPSAQASLVSCQTQKIPLVFTAVTDPVGAKLVNDLKGPPVGITGVTDKLEPKEQLRLVKELVPSVKTIGIIYNSGELNSLKMVQDLKEVAADLGVTLIEATVNKMSDVAAATQSLAGKVQAIYVPNDNTVVSAIRNVVIVGEKEHIPVFAGDIGSVESGAIATKCYDRHELGTEAGKLALQMLKNPELVSIPVSENHSLITVINIKAAERMGLPIPEELRKMARII